MTLDLRQGFTCKSVCIQD